MFATMIKGKGEDYYLVAERDGAVSVTEGSDASVKGVEDSYNRFHNRGYESSMSACVHDIFFQPAIIPIPDSIDELKLLLDMDAGLHKLHNISGSYYGWKIKPEVAKQFLERQIRPRLISDETFAKPK